MIDRRNTKPKIVFASKEKLVEIQSILNGNTGIHKHYLGSEIWKHISIPEQKSILRLQFQAHSKGVQLRIIYWRASKQIPTRNIPCRVYIKSPPSAFSIASFAFLSLRHWYKDLLRLPKILLLPDRENKRHSLDRRRRNPKPRWNSSVPAKSTCFFESFESARTAFMIWQVSFRPLGLEIL